MSFVLQLLFGWTVMTGGAQPAVHWRATYIDAAGEHTIEAWRTDGHVRRITDGVLVLDAVRTPDTYRFVVVDRRRGVSYRGDAHARITSGHFDDWETWIHVVAPRAPDALAVPLDHPQPHACAWYRDGDRDICWSRALAIPLVVRTGGRAVYTVTTTERFAGTLPELPPTGIELGGDTD